MSIPLFEIGFLEIRLLDILDILIVAYLMFLIFRLLRGTIAFNIFIGVLIFYFVWWIVGILEMELLSQLLGRFVAFGVLILIVIFQPEVRRFLVILGNSTLRGRFAFIDRFFSNQSGIDAETEKNILEVNKAVLSMASNKTGALIVMMNGRDPDMFKGNGTHIDCNISKPMLESIFNKHSPLHDGAVIIAKDRIYGAGSVLPVSANRELPKRLGLRHRSGVGATESSNIAVIIVSEETGKISYAYQGKIEIGINDEFLLNKLRKHLIR